MLMAMLVLGALWMGSLQCQHTMTTCRLVLATWGITYAMIATQLIMVHMAKQPFQPALWPYAVLAAGSGGCRWLSPISDGGALLLAAAALGVSTIMYMHYVITCIRQICKHLGIYALTIKHAPAAKEPASRAAAMKRAKAL